MFPQIDKLFRCIDIYNRKAPVALWVHPLTLYYMETINGKYVHRVNETTFRQGNTFIHTTGICKS